MARSKKERRRNPENVAGTGTKGSAKERTLVTRVLLWGLPVLAIAAAALLYFVVGSSQLAAIAAMFLFLAWLGLALGNLGASVPPRDRTRAGSIDFGRRN